MTSVMKTFKDGSTDWRNEKGEYHRVDGPALEFSDGNKYWFINDCRHRSDGPAVEQNGTKMWFLYGNHIPHEEVDKWLEENDYTYPFNKEIQTEFILRFSQ